MQIQDTMKQENGNYGKKLKQWNDEAFNIGKETEGMKSFWCLALAILK